MVEFYIGGTVAVGLMQFIYTDGDAGRAVIQGLLWPVVVVLLFAEAYDWLKPDEEKR